MAVAASAVWRVRPAGNTANGGGYDGSAYPGGSDYSQQNFAQAVFNGTSITGSTSGVSNVVTLSGYTVSANDDGNVVQIAGGANFTAGFYFVTAVNTGANTWTLDRNCTTGAGSGMTGNLGGAWGGAAANSLTANLGAGSPVVGGNTVFILGTGIPNPASANYGTGGTADYTCNAAISPAQGTAGVNLVHYKGDPATPNYAAGGMPSIFTGELFANNSLIHLDALWFIAAGANSSHAIIDAARLHTGIVCDQNGYDIGYSASGSLHLCEVFSSAAPRGTQAQSAVTAEHFGPHIYACNIHDTVGPGVAGGQQPRLYYTIVAKCRGDGVTIVDDGSHGVYHAVLQNCTIDANLGNGITISNAGDAGVIQDLRLFNCLVTNHTGIGKYGVACNFGTIAANDLARVFLDWNGFFGNTNDLQNLSYGPHDTLLSASPYVAQATENYTLKAALSAGGTPNNGSFAAPSFSTAYAAYRIRMSGNDLNGAGYNVTASVAASGSHGAISGTIFADTVAAAFTAGMVGASVLVSGVGQYKITAFIDAGHVTLGAGAPTLAAGAGYNWLVGNGIDYSQQDAAQASGTNGAGSGTTILTDTTANAFTAAMVNNVVNIAGQGFYTVKSFTDAGHVVVDRSLGTFSGASWRLGGGWATITGNTNTAGPLVEGNLCYILGSGQPTPGVSGISYVFDYTVNGNNGAVASGATGTAGLVKFKGDPATPSFTGTIGGGMPCIRTIDALMFYDLGFGSASAALYSIEDAWIVAGGNGNHKNVLASGKFFRNLIFDQNGWDVSLSGGGGTMIGVELFSNQAKRSTNAQNAMLAEHYGPLWAFCNAHDLIGPGLWFGSSIGGTAGQATLTDTIVAGCGGLGVFVGSAGTSSGYYQMIGICTIDGNATGVTIEDTKGVTSLQMFDTLLTNNTTGVNASGGTGLAANDAARFFFDWNTYEGNGADLNTIDYGPDDVHGGANPYQGQATENYALTAAVPTEFPSVPFPQHLAGQTNTVKGNFYPGAVQPISAVGNAYPPAAFPQHLSGKTNTVRTNVSPGAVQPGPVVTGWLADLAARLPERVEIVGY